MGGSIQQLEHGKQARFARLVADGSMVPNAPFRARVEFLLAHDPEFTLGYVCARLADEGFPKFIKTANKQARRHSPDTSHLQRLLGMRDMAATNRNGRRYVPPNRTEFISYEFAVALTRALGLDPVDMGV